MKPILKKLGFTPMSQFIEERLDIKLDCNDIFIKCNHEFPSLSTKESMSSSDILSYALEVCSEGNQLCNGYCKATKKWYSTNTSRNLLKSEKWAKIFDGLGWEYSIFVLTRSSIIEKVNQSLVFVCGDFGENIEKKQVKATVQREKLFYGRDELVQISLENAIEGILMPCIWNRNEIVGRLAKVFNKFNKLPLRSLFKSYFSQQKCRSDGKTKYNNQGASASTGAINDGNYLHFQQSVSMKGAEDSVIHTDGNISKHQTDPESIANFLFMISKKFLRPAFGLRDFKVLKGKLILLLKRNLHETVSREELMKYLRIHKLKLFRGVENLSFTSKSYITGNFLLFIFNRIYLNILSFFFYSTTSSFSKAKVLYFTRAEWNRSVSQFVSKYLKQFTKVKDGTHFATLRCIPKENGFRVVSNCSKINSYVSKMKTEHINKNKESQWKIDEYPETYFQCAKHASLSLEKLRKRYDEVDSIFRDEDCSMCIPEGPAFLGIGHLSASQSSTMECRAKPQNRNAIKYESGSSLGLENNCNSKYTVETKHSSCIRSKVNICDDMKGIMSESKYDTKESMVRSKASRNIFPSINSLVASVYPILKKESSESIGYSLMDHRDVKTRLFTFLKSAKQRLYMMKVDLDKCFDNIPKEDLISVLSNLFKKDEYHFQEFILLKESDITANKMEIKYVRKAPDVMYPINIAEGHLNSSETHSSDGNFIIKENRVKIFSRSEVLNRIRNIIENTNVYYQNAYYRPNKGIPQGCSISPILCALYYGQMDNEFKHLNGFISRFVDDFLIITPHLSVIRSFLKIAYSLRKKGFVINRNKICANFDVDTVFEEVMLENSNTTSERPTGNNDAVFTANYVEWCGMKIYDSGVALKSVLGDKYFRYSVYVSGPNIGRRVFLKIKKSFEAKCSSLYISRLNIKSGENMFDAFYFVGRRLKILILRAGFINKKFVEKILDWCVERAKAIIKKRRMQLDDTKVDSIASSAFEKCGVLEIRKKPFDRW